MKASSIISLAIVAVAGALLVNVFSLPTYISFILGMIASIAVLRFTNNKYQPSSQISPVSSNTKTLYVGNLPYRANESDVRKLFSEEGNVVSVRLMKDKRTGKRRGFGFVVVDAASAQTMIKKYNNKEYMQRTLKVRVANDPKHPSESAEQD